MEIPKCAGRKRLERIIITAAVLLPFFISTVEASWPDDPTVNLPVCIAAQMQSSPDAIPDGSGGIIIVWQDARGVGHDIYAQRIAADGTAMWDPNGVSICGAADEQEFAQIVSDGLGGAIIVWEDRRLVGQNIYAQRIDADGIAQWMPNGIVVCDGPTYENQIQAIADGLGGAIVCWTDGRDGLPDIYAQRISAAGDTLWTFDGTEVCTDKADQVESQLTSDGSGGAIVSWVDGRGSRAALYIQRIDAGGGPVWTTDGIAVTDTNVSQDQQRLVSDGSNGAIITWADQRGASLDIYGQRIAGGLRVWGQNGVPICTLMSDADTPRSVADGSGGVIVAWYDYRTGDGNIYAQGVNGDGLVQWTGNGVAICVDGGEQIFPRIATDGFGGAVIAWRDYRLLGTGSDVYARRVNGSGEAYWAADGVAVSTAPEDQTGTVLVPDGMGGATLAWFDERSDAGDIMAQHVGSNGELGDLVPVAIAGFVARPSGGAVELTWVLSADEAVAGYRIYRESAGEENAIVVNAGLINAIERRFFDRSAIGGNEYWYTLAVVLADGTEYRSETVAITMPVGNLTLEQNYPNPFNPSTTIEYSIAERGQVTLEIYDVSGRLVKTLVDEVQDPTRVHAAIWDGKNDLGNPVSAGVYFYRLTFKDLSRTKTMVVLK